MLCPPLWFRMWKSAVCAGSMQWHQVHSTLSLGPFLECSPFKIPCPIELPLLSENAALPTGCSSLSLCPHLFSVPPSPPFPHTFVLFSSFLLDPSHTLGTSSVSSPPPQHCHPLLSPDTSSSPRGIPSPSETRGCLIPAVTPALAWPSPAQGAGSHSPFSSLTQKAALCTSTSPASSIPPECDQGPSERND